MPAEWQACIDAGMGRPLADPFYVANLLRLTQGACRKRGFMYMARCPVLAEAGVWEICACQDTDSLFDVFNTAAANRASKAMGPPLPPWRSAVSRRPSLPTPLRPSSYKWGATASFRETVRLKSYQPCPCSRSKKP